MLKFLTRFSALMAVLIVSALPLDAFAIRPRYKAVSYNTSRPAFERLVRGLTPTMDIRAGKLSQLDSDPQTVLDASNLTMWLDPNANVTTVDGKVSQWDARDGSGISFTQGTASARPILSRSDNKENRIYNSALKDWTSGAGLTDTDDVADWNGGTEAVTITTSGGSTRHYKTAQASIRPNIPAGEYVFQVYVKQETSPPFYAWIGHNGASWAGSIIDHENGSVIDENNVTSTTVEEITASDGTTWYRVAVTIDDQASYGQPAVTIGHTDNTTASNGPRAFDSDGVELTFATPSAYLVGKDSDYIATTGTPAYAGINGNKGLVFLGGQELGSTSTYDDLINAGDKTLYLALKPFDLPTTADHILYVGGNGLKTTTNAFQFRNYSGGGYTVDESGAVNTTAIVKITHASATTLGISSDTGSGFSTPTTVGTGSTGTMTGVITLGNETSGSAYFNGYILDIITADASSQADVEAYLQAKYFNVVTPRVNQIDSTIGSVSFTQGTDANKPLLTEGSRRENLLTRSEEINNAVWTKNETTVSTDSVANPITAEVNADLVTESSNTSVSPYISLASAFPYIGSVEYRQSVYVKANGRTAFRLYGSNGSYVYSDVNLTTETITASTATTSSLEDLGNGWFRFTQTFTPASTATGLSSLYFANPAGTITYNGDGTSGMYVWGFQLQRASMSPTYIPTQTLPRHGSLTGQRGLYFDGSNDTMDSSAFNLSQPYTAYAIGFPYNSGYFIDGSDGTHRSLIFPVSDDVSIHSGATLSSTTVWTSTPRVISALFNNTSSSIRNSDGSLTSGSAGNHTITGLTLGSSYVPNSWMQGYVDRYVLYSGGHGTSTRQRLMKGFKRFYRVN